MTTQEKCVEAKKEMNSMHERSDVSNRHMTWWRKRMVGPYGQRTTPTDGARPSKSVASSHESRAGNARDRTGSQGEKGREWEHEKRGEEETQHVLHVVFHFPDCNNNVTATATSATTSSSSWNGSSTVSGDAASVTSTTGVLQLKELANKNELFFRRETRGFCLRCSCAGCNPHWQRVFTGAGSRCSWTLLLCQWV